MNKFIKTATLSVLAVSSLSFGGCLRQNHNQPQQMQQQPQGDIRKLQRAECFARQQARMAGAESRRSEALMQQSLCNTDGCLDYWRAKLSEARQESEDATNSVNSLECIS